MKRASAAACATILGALAALHVAWASGSDLFSAGVVPTRPGVNGTEDGALFEPSPASTLAVAAALMLGAVVVLRAGFTRSGNGPARLVAFAFGARALGEFRYVGITKRVKGTPFARKDSRIYVPLCTVVSLLAARAAR